MVEESMREVTRKAIRMGKLALMRPVITSTVGRWVARITCKPAARPFWARRITEVVMLRASALDSGPAPTDMVRSAYSSITTTM